MTPPSSCVGTFSGRQITVRELETIQETVSLYSSLSHTELTHTICEHLQWHTVSGSNKWDACASMLEKFEQKGLICLPQKIKRTPQKPAKIIPSGNTEPGPPAQGSLKRLQPVDLEPVHTQSQVKLWNEYVQRYHFLGYKKPFGYRLRYFIQSDKQLLGCLLFAGAARAVTQRDKWIGWTSSQRRKNLSLVINNSRFLIFPWVKITNLASHSLSLAARRIPGDWKQKFGFTPALLETFVDPVEYKGTCYTAANWRCLGLTSGKGLVRQGCTYQTHPKKIFAYPLTPHFRQILCNE